MGLYSLKLKSDHIVILAPNEGLSRSTPAIWDRCRTFVAPQAQLQAAVVVVVVVALAAFADLVTLTLVLDSDAVGPAFASGSPAVLPDGSQGAAVGRVAEFERLTLVSHLPRSRAGPSGGQRAADGSSWGRQQGWEEWRGRRRGRRMQRRRRGSHSPGRLAAETLPGGSDGSSEEVEESREGSLPSFAYSISGHAEGHGSRMARLLSVVYHLRNAYCLHMDAAAGEEEMEVVRGAVSGDPLMAEAGNVFVVEKRNLVTYRGSTQVTLHLHCATILLEGRQHWDWLINLSSSDYPLVTQDGCIEPKKLFWMKQVQAATRHYFVPGSSAHFRVASKCSKGKCGQSCPACSFDSSSMESMPSLASFCCTWPISTSPTNPTSPRGHVIRASVLPSST